MDLYECTLTRLRAADIDQEVKERAISCMGQIMCNMGDNLQKQLPVSGTTHTYKSTQFHFNAYFILMFPSMYML